MLARDDDQNRCHGQSAATWPPADITDLVNAWGGGDCEALNAAVDKLYTELEATSRRLLAGEASGHTLPPGALVHELYLRLRAMTGRNRAFENRTAFLAFAAKVMRHVLVDHARQKRAVKRGGDRKRVELESEPPVQVVGGGEAGPGSDLPAAPWGERAIEVLALEEALGDLREIAPRLSDLVVYRFYGGMTEQETATALEVSRATVQRDWAFAKRWLYQRLEPSSQQGSSP